MSERDEPAFPVDHSDDRSYTAIRGGLTKREYFAAAALQGMLASNFMRDDGSGHWTPETRASHAYQFADAMIRAGEAETARPEPGKSGTGAEESERARNGGNTAKPEGYYEITPRNTFNEEKPR